MPRLRPKHINLDKEAWVKHCYRAQNVLIGLVETLLDLTDPLSPAFLFDQVEFFKQNVQNSIFDFTTIITALDRFVEDDVIISSNQVDLEEAIRKHRAAALVEAEARREAYKKAASKASLQMSSAEKKAKDLRAKLNVLSLEQAELQKKKIDQLDRTITSKKELLMIVDDFASFKEHHQKSNEVASSCGQDILARREALYVVVEDAKTEAAHTRESFGERLRLFL